MLVTRERIATLLVSPTPFTDADARPCARIADELGFAVRVAPWTEAADERLAAHRQRGLGRPTLAARPRDPVFRFHRADRPAAVLLQHAQAARVLSTRRVGERRRRERQSARDADAARARRRRRRAGRWRSSPGRSWRAGRPRRAAGVFARRACATSRSSASAFMFDPDSVSAALLGLPRPSDVHVFDHPVPDDSCGRARQLRVGARSTSTAPAAGAAARSASALAVLVETLLLQPVDRSDGRLELPGRTLVVAAFVVPLAFVLGYCFPIGLRLLGRHSDRVTAWMWGVNGACGVMASILAVMGSMWLGIHVNLSSPRRCNRRGRRPRVPFYAL